LVNYLLPILSTTLNNGRQSFLLSSLNISNNIHKDEHLFHQICIAKEKWLHKFPSSLWHICKMCNPLFFKVANYATFQKTKKKSLVP
jgi:hypothetical protein